MIGLDLQGNPFRHSMNHLLAYIGFLWIAENILVFCKSGLYLSKFSSGMELFPCLPAKYFRFQKF